MASLRFQNTSRTGEVVKLESGDTIIGRNASQCDFTIHDESISRRHVRIFKQDGSYFVEDLNSLNGTFVNDFPVEESCRLFNRDILRLNLIQLSFHGGDNRSEEQQTGQTTSITPPPILHSLDPGEAEYRVGEVAEAKVRATLQIIRALGASLDADEIVHRLVTAIAKVFPQAEGVYALLADRAGGPLRMRAKYSKAENASLTAGPFSMTLVNQVVESRQAILSSEHSLDSRLASVDSIHDDDRQSVMCAPLKGASDAPLGVIQVDTDSKQRFEPADLDVLTVAALQAGRAVEHGRLHEAFMQAERLSAIGQMMTGLAHESRNALQRSQSTLERLKLRVSADDGSLDLIARVQAAQDELHELYERVRAYAAPIRLKRDRHDLGQLLMEAWEHLEPERAGRMIDFDPGFGEDFDRRASVDPLVIHRVFANLLSNGLGAASDPVRLQISWRDAWVDDAPAIEIEVSDNGPGISPEIYEEIFRPFFTTKQTGTGLGLALVKRYIESHGGWISPGKSEAGGASFHLVLPREE